MLNFENDLRKYSKTRFNALGFSAILHLALFFHGPAISPYFACTYFKSDLPLWLPAFNTLFFAGFFFTFFVEKGEKTSEKGKNMK